MELKILADNKDVTEQLSTRLLSLSITDEAGFTSDILTLTLDDSEGIIELIKKGKKLEVSIQSRPMGIYTVDEVELTGPPDRMVIRAKGADFLQDFKSTSTQSWDQVTLGDIVADVAKKHGLNARVNADISTLPIEHIDQAGESDINFLTRLAKDYNAVFKPMGEYLVFTVRNKSQTASGKELPVIELKKTEVINYRLLLADRSDFGQVIAYWRNEKVDRMMVTVGTDSPCHILQRVCPSRSEALAKAQATLDGFKRGKKQLSITVIGNPSILAESPLKLSEGWREGYAGDYVVTRVEHKLDSSGYTTSITAC